jgi:membrane-associated phospholipid phosphatase
MKLIRENLPFFLPYFVLIMAGLVLNFEYAQKDIFLFVNKLNSPFADSFFRYFTNVGDGLFYLLVTVFVSLITLRKGVICLAAWALQGGIVQFLKRVAFPDNLRPWKMLNEDKMIHLVPDFKPYYSNSFPSGHSATAFCLFALLSIFSRRKWAGLVYFCLALLVVYSRIYLSLHFFLDTYAGMLIGLFSALASYYFFSGSRFQNENFERPVFGIKRYIR